MKSVFLSAGHSDTDPGATVHETRTVSAVATRVLRKEADIGVAFRNMVAFYLQRAGVPFELDGAGRQNLPLKEAAARARYHPIGVEFHCNAAAALTATGSECLAGPKDMALAAALSAAIAKGLGIRDRGAKPENAGQHHRLAFVRAGGIVVELFFLTNPDDLAAYDARCWLAASAVADVLIAAAKGG